MLYILFISSSFLVIPLLAANSCLRCEMMNAFLAFSFNFSTIQANRIAATESCRKSNLIDESMLFI